MTEKEARTEEQNIKQLADAFWDAYKALRQAWLETGGGMDMEIKVRDASAEATYQKRRQAAAARKRR
jgi:hypothetical protein